ncbi:hypothetical protein FSARC_9442 [Fusarium sarcochroum]|uniref:Clr5 domain-containing protein n=1 Tax=Fusarium sarcochroum TaxID=1208366 RepID=A0A8H4TRE8_9HYPO|nr:hypothetical protein FSARC_9442 [Fusarium sarcochroum]
MSRATMIPKEEWDKNKEHIRDFYLTQNGNVDGLISYMSQNHNFVASKAQYIRKLHCWKMKKYSSQYEWEHIKRVIGERKNDGKETKIIIRGQIVPVKKLKKELGRHAYDRYGPPALTPPTPADILVRGYTIPWIQFQDITQLLVSQPTMQSASPTHSAILSNWQSYPHDLVELFNHVSSIVWAASDHDEDFARAMSGLQSQVPNCSSLDIITQCHTSASDPVVQVFEGLIYRLSNNIRGLHDAYDMLSPLFKSNHTSRLLEKVCSEGGSTIRIVLLDLLLGAIQKEDVPLIEYLLKLGASPEAKQIKEPWQIVLGTDMLLGTALGTDMPWETALGTAAKLQNSEIVRLLLLRGADPNNYTNNSHSSDSCGESPLMQALQSPGGYDVVKQLVDAGADINTPVKQAGFYEHMSSPTPLIQAAANGDIRVAQLLIERGSEINIVSWNYSSAIQRAISRNDLDMLVFLLNNGADLNIRPSYGCGENLGPRVLSSPFSLPLVVAARHGHIKIAQCLLDFGAEVDGFIPSGFRLFDHETGLQISIQRCDLAMTELLLRKGASPNTRDATTPSALQQACQLFRDSSRQKRIINLLLESGADVNADPPTCDGGETALQIATRFRDYDLITSLISHGGSINSPRSCLQTAIPLGNIDLVKFLLENGADANSQSHRNWLGRTRTVLQTALSSGSTKLVGLLLSAGAVLNAQPPPSGMSDLQAVLLSGNIELVQMVMRSGANVNENTLAWQQTPLEQAASLESVELVSLLVEPNITINQGFFESALECAVKNCCTSIVQLLLESGADIDIKPMEPRFLYMAIQSRCEELFDLSFTRSADPDIFAELTGFLMAAIDYRWLYAVDRVIQAGVDVNKSHEGEALGSDEELDEYCGLPLQKAVATQQITFVERLVHAGGDIKTRGLEYLKIAVKLRTADIVHLLLEHGVSPNQIFAGSSLTPLHLSLIDIDRFDLDIVKMLVEYKADVNAHSSEVGCPLQIIWRKTLDQGWTWDESNEYADSPQARDWRQAKDLLLEAGADPAQLPSALQMAARKGDIEKARLLITNGEEVNRTAIEYKGATALQYAAMHGHFNIAALLLKNGADIHAPGAKIDGRTALQGAAENGRLDIVHLLLENDDEIDLVEERCCDAAEYAAREEHTMIAETPWAWSCMKTVSTMPYEDCGT